MKKEFLGYERENKTIGTRNYVLVIPMKKSLNFIAKEITHLVTGTKTVTNPAQFRPKYDRLILQRIFVGLGLNPNTASVLLLGTEKDKGYEELKEEKIAKTIAQSGKRVEILYEAEAGGVYGLLGKGIKMAREMAIEASKFRRKLFGIEHLSVAVKCGMTDLTSGVSGNPTVGKVLDKIVESGGKSFFSETTEIIGAEHILIKRARNAEIAKKILKVANTFEEAGKSVGIDIAAINPIPENIAGGISTLEEKSLGAILKSGTSVIEDVLQYAERPTKKGLYFMDSSPSSLTVPVGFSAAGANIFIFQVGGAGLSEIDPSIAAYNTSIITPFMYITGNSNTFKKAEDDIDFNSGLVFEGKETLEEASERLLEKIIDVASGTKTKMETINYEDPIELDFKGPKL